MLRRGVGLALGLASGALLCSAQTPLLPQGCDLLLLAGLPGDAESEAVYREQLQSWIDLACASTGPARVFALCDAPEAIRSPSGGKVTVLKNDREAFLGLPQTLGGRSNALVVIAWGHGGRQRNRPVLHVRGPRLTPEDFSVVAKKAGNSQWVLLFRGSGSFAQQLAGPETRVISSDAGQSFNSDPVSMPLLLKLARGGEGKSFDTLARELGRATAAWYEERSLARTEDPALWTGEDKPQLLAAASSSASQLGAEPAEAAETQTAAAEPRKEDDGTRAETPRKLETTGVWSTIKRVNAGDFAEFDAVVLNQRLSCAVGSSPALTTEQEEFIQVLTPEGKTLGDFDISFAPPHEEIEFQECEVLRPDGELVRLDPDRIGESRDQPLGDYQAQRRKFFSLPGVTPGAVIHVRYRTQWKQFPLPQISMALPLGKEIPALVSTVQISVPKKFAFHWGFERMPPSDPVVRQTSYAASYTWIFTNVPAHRKEVLSPPLQAPRLLFSTFRDWADFAGWYERISRLSGEVTPEIETTAKGLTAKSTTDREKLVALYNYVTALRYVAVPLGINSVRPHAAANVLQNQFGDCKDKANLLNAMLRALKIDAHLVLVPRFSQAYDAVPGLAFNHAISRVKLGPEWLWLDTTDDVCRFGMLPPGDYGRKVLVIDGQTQTLAELPVADPKDHRLQIDGTLQWKQGQSSPARFKAVGVGHADYELRSAAREARENHAALPLLSSKFRPVSGAFALKRQQSTAVSALSEDFSLEAEGECVGVASQKGQSIDFHAPFWIPKEWDFALHERENPLFLNQGYPLTLEQKLQVQLPTTPQAVLLPKLAENNQGPLRYRVAWARIGDDTLEAQLKAQLQTGELNAAQTVVFQNQLRGLLGALAARANVADPSLAAVPNQPSTGK